MRFGETAAENAARRGNDTDVWIKNFKEGSTRVRFLQDTDSFATYREHYSEGPGYFPCSEDSSTCPGCTDSNPKVQKRTRKYAMNCLGESGRVDIQKIGSRMYKTLAAREQRLETIQDRDYLIIRSGTMLDTVYDIEAGERYALTDPVELHDIGAILEGIFNNACEAYGIDPEDAPSQDEGGGGEVAASQEPAREPIGSGDTSKEDSVTAIRAGRIKLGDADTDDLRKLLTQGGVEFPSRTPRARLETLVTEWITANPLF